MSREDTVVSAGHCADGPKAPPRLRVLTEPQPQSDELLVSVPASSVNGIDRALASGGLLETIPHEFPFVLGHDFAGVVERVGSDVALYREGDEVLGFVALSVRNARSGTWADYLVVPEGRYVARKPASVGFVHAGTLALAGVAALASVDAVATGPGDVALVVGATGGVGAFAVELASNRGARVVATSTTRDERRLRQLGALLASGRRAVSTRAAAAGISNGVDVCASPESSVLERVARLADAGHLRAPIANVYPLEEANSALEEYAAGARGKIGLLLANGR